MHFEKAKLFLNHLLSREIILKLKDFENFTEMTETKEHGKRGTMWMIGDAMRQYLPYSQLGIQLVLTVALASLAGFALDRLFSTGVVFSIVLSLLGVAVAVYTVLTTDRTLRNKTTKE